MEDTDGIFGEKLEYDGTVTEERFVKQKAPTKGIKATDGSTHMKKT